MNGKVVLGWLGLVVILIAGGCRVTNPFAAHYLPVAKQINYEDGIDFAEAVSIAQKAVLLQAAEADWLDADDLLIDEIELAAEDPNEWHFEVPQKNSIATRNFDPPIMVLVLKENGQVLYVGRDE